MKKILVGAALLLLAAIALAVCFQSRWAKTNTILKPPYAAEYSHLIAEVPERYHDMLQRNVAIKAAYQQFRIDGYVRSEAEAHGAKSMVLRFTNQNTGKHAVIAFEIDGAVFTKECDHRPDADTIVADPGIAANAPPSPPAPAPLPSKAAEVF